jgi:hypothetical protein
MSALEATEVSRPESAPIHLSRPAPGIIAALFCGYLCVGLPLPVIPLFIHDHLGCSNKRAPRLERVVAEARKHHAVIGNRRDIQRPISVECLSLGVRIL